MTRKTIACSPFESVAAHAPRLALCAFATMTALCPLTARADETGTATMAVDTEVKLLSDLRNRGVSDSGRKPSLQLGVQIAHESGFIGLAQLSTVSRKAFTDGDGLNLLLGTGYRFGDPDGWHFGLGLAKEFFPGAKFDAPHGIDMEAGVPVDFRRTRYDTAYAVLEIGWGKLEGRILNVLSRTYRGADTGGVCGQILVAGVDPTPALECYGRGDNNSRGSMLYELAYRHPLTPTTTLNLHAGTQKIRHFKEADFSDYSIGVTHQRWGLSFTAEWVATRTHRPELFMIPDGDGWKRQDNNTLVVSVSRKF
nr:TorF family putative porin [uncultured Roseateles sp.]